MNTRNNEFKWNEYIKKPDWLRVVFFYDAIGVGLSYRTGDAIVAMFELQVASNFRFGYAFDYTITEISNYSSGTHEVILRYEFGFGSKKVITPRYF